MTTKPKDPNVTDTDDQEVAPARKLKTSVIVHTPDKGTVVYGPGSEIPEDHAALITNPKVWVED